MDGGCVLALVLAACGVVAVLRLASLGGSTAGGEAPSLTERLQAPDSASFEAALGRPLPAEILDFHRRDPRRFLADVELNGDVVAWFLPLDTRTFAEYGLADALLPLAVDGSGSRYCVDLGDPALLVLLFDEDEPEPFAVSDRFDTFLDALEGAARAAGNGSRKDAGSPPSR